MSMHLVGPYMTTTNYKKRKKKKMTLRQLETYQENLRKHNKDMRRMGLHNMQMDLEQYIAYCTGSYKPQHKNTQSSKMLQTETYRRETPHIPSLGNGIGNGLKKETSKYTGDLIVGIATMHKSNAVPVMRGTDQAKDIAQMRRN